MARVWWSRRNSDQCRKWSDAAGGSEQGAGEQTADLGPVSVGSAAAGVEATIRQGVAATGMRRARYRGLPKTQLEHVYSATALNLIRLHAYWNGHALDRSRTSHLTRLELALAALSN